MLLIIINFLVSSIKFYLHLEHLVFKILALYVTKFKKPTIKKKEFSFHIALPLLVPIIKKSTVHSGS